MSAHAPTPWVVQEMPPGCNDRITADDGEGRTICEFPYGLDANAAFIVRAVNAHDDLVAALRELVAIDEWMVLVGGTEGPIAQEHIEEAARRRVPAIDAARAALAKAGAA